MSVLTLVLAAFSQPLARADEQSDVGTELIAEVRENISTTPGREVYRFVPARLLEQGQVVYYTLRITNQTTVPLRNVAVVRYDAFGDMGGRLSFSCAVVDDEGDGLVISSIHARGESRTYAKGIVGGSSEITLTPEEQEALSAARGGPVRSTTRTTAPTTARERR